MRLGGGVIAIDLFIELYMLISRRFLRALLVFLAGFCLSPIAGAESDLLGRFVGDLLGESLYSRAQKKTGLAACAHFFPAAKPLDLGRLPQHWRPIGLCSNSFAVVYSGLTRTPLLVIERLTARQLSDASDERRTDAFFADPRLPHDTRAELHDYAGSGFDRGHLAAAGEQPDQTSMAQSFALSNIVPQNPTNNRKIWSKIESDVRKFARRAGGDVYVFTGPLFTGQKKTIGPNRVRVPSHLFKLVYDERSRRAWAYIIENAAETRVAPPVSYEEFVNRTGWPLLNAVTVTGSTKRRG